MYPYQRTPMGNTYIVPLRWVFMVGTPNCPLINVEKMTFRTYNKRQALETFFEIFGPHKPIKKVKI